jgi:hypothetical protein
MSKRNLVIEEEAQITNVEPGKSLASPGLAQPNCARIWEVIRPRRDPVRVGS